jgi:hypothetical protein
MLSGEKTSTARYRPYGQAGDWFVAFGAGFDILAVSRKTLQDVIDIHWKQEGFNDRWECIDFWKGLHPRRGLRPGDLIWYHTFELQGGSATVRNLTEGG